MLFLKYSEDAKCKRYTLRNGVKPLYISFPILFIFALISLFFMPQLSLLILLILFLIGVFSWFLFLFLEFRFIIQQIRNKWNGKKIIYSGGIKAIFSRRDFTIVLEK